MLFIIQIASERKIAMREFTTNELLDHLGLSSAGTIQKWKREGLIPEPTVRPVETGRGRKAYWSEWVLERCVEIRRLVKQGKTLEEIKLILADVETEAKKSKRKYRFSEMSEQMDRQREHFKVQDFLVTQVRHASRQYLGDTDYETFDREHFDKAISLLKQGFDPVFLIAGETRAVVADIDVVHILSRDRAGSLILLVPIGKIIRELRPEKEVKFRPVNKVAEQLKNGSERERKYTPATDSLL